MKVKNKFDIRLRELKLVNFRRFEELTVPFDENLTVLIGKNGAGKTTVLDGIGSLLTFIESKIVKEPPKPVSLNRYDILNGTFEAVNTLTVSLIKQEDGQEKDKEETQEEKELSWYASLTSTGFEPEAITDPSSWNELDTLVTAIDKQLKRNEPASLPALDYFTCDFATSAFFTEKNGTQRPVDSTNPFNAYGNSFTQLSLDFKLFFDWYKWRERIEIQTGKDSLKRNVEKAILDMLSDTENKYENLHTDYLKLQEGELKIIENGKELIVNQFSSGRKMVLTLAANIAWRLSLLNKDLENPLHGNGIFLIDEIDMHLHPAWARELVPNLRKTFPNVQFVITTHSPYVVSKIPSRQILIIDDGKIFSASDTQGQDVSTILNKVMDAPTNEHQEEINHIFDLLALDKLDEAEKNIEALESKIEGSLPELSRAKAIINRKRILAK